MSSRRVALVVSFLVVCGGLAVVRVGSVVDRINGVDDVINYLVFGWGERTEYGRRYSEAGFLAIRPGMTLDEVLAHIGPPLRVMRMRPTKELVLYYSRPQVRGGDYWLRYVSVDSSQVVSLTERAFYTD